MQVKGIIWVGSVAEDLNATAAFFAQHLGMTITDEVPGFTRLAIQNGDRVELFGPNSVEHDHLDTGPVAGFWVEDIEEAQRELQNAGVDGVTELEHGSDGHRWFYFQAPDGRFYELCEHPRPRPVKGGMAWD